MLPVRALRWAENRISAVSNPTSAMIAPTTSSRRSGVRLSHQETETGSGCSNRADFPLEEAGLPFAFPCEGDAALPLGFPPDFEEEGVLRGMTVESIAQMVCFSSRVKLQNTRSAAERAAEIADHWNVGETRHHRVPSPLSRFCSRFSP